MSEIDIMIHNNESVEEIAKFIFNLGHFDGDGDDALRCAHDLMFQGDE